MKRFKIWSNEHDAWWSPEGFGYTKFFREAGIFNQEDAERICIRAQIRKGDVPAETMWPFDDREMEQ